MSTTWQGGSTRAWRKARAEVLLRDGYTCTLQLPDVCTGRADCVHHTLGRSTTGDDPTHLQAACTPCNLAVGDPTQTDPPSAPVTAW